MTVHSDECLKHFAAWETLKNNFLKRFPNHCTSCSGWCGFAWSGGRDEPDGYDVCDACEDKCSTCGADVPDDWHDRPQACESCGRMSDQPEGIPEGPECVCVDLGDIAERSRREL